MRTLLTILLLILSVAVSAQVTYKWRYYSKDLGGGKTGYFLVGMPSDSASNPNKRPTFCFEPGSGETGGSGKMSQANALMYFVPTLYNSKWSGGVKQGTAYSDSTVYPVYIVAQYDYSATSLPSETKLRWDAVWADYSSYIDTDQIHFGGISLGGLTTLAMVTGRQGLTSATGIFSHKPASFLIASPGGKFSYITDSAYHMGVYAKRGGRLIIATGKNEDKGAYFPSELIGYANDSVANSAIGYVYESGVDGFTSDGHNGWDTLWSGVRTFSFIGGKNVYEWQAQFTKAPKAVAQSTINTGASSVTLNGVSKGWDKTVAWTKVSGGSATITSPSSDTTTVTGLSEGTYVFRMTVTNTSDSRTATHDVTVTVSGTPPESGEKIIGIKKKGQIWYFKKEN